MITDPTPASAAASEMASTTDPANTSDTAPTATETAADVMADAIADTAVTVVRDAASGGSKTTREQVLGVFLEASPDALTDANLGSRLPHLHRGQYSPARVRLFRAGRVEPAGTNEAGVELWRAVIDPARYEEVAAQATCRPKRRVTWDRAKPEAKAGFILRALRDCEVRAAVDAARAEDRGARRAKAESRRESQAEYKERKARLKQAKNDKEAHLEFLKIHNHLKDALLATSGIGAFLTTEQARLDNGEPWRVPPAKWPQVHEALVELLQEAGGLRAELAEWIGIEIDGCPACGHRAAPAVAEGYIELTDEDVIVDAETVD
jgi:hypothetical protein